MLFVVLSMLTLLSMFFLDVSRKIDMKDIQFTSDLSLSTQDSNLSVSGPGGTWRNIKSKTIIGKPESSCNYILYHIYWSSNAFSHSLNQ